MTDPRHEELLAALSLSERRRLETQRLGGVGFWELHHKEEWLYWSEEIFAIYELNADALEPDYAVFTDLIHDDDRDLVDNAYRSSVASGEEYDIRYRIKTPHGYKWIEARGVTYYDSDGSPERSIGTAQDISEIIDAQRATEKLALHDALTGLPNRALLSDRMMMALKRADRDSMFVAIIFMDLDDFKKINDQHGHDVGDEVLIAIAKKLTQIARTTDTFARIGGDEFVGLLVDRTERGIDSSVRRIKEEIEDSYETRVGNLRVTTSIGVTVYPTLSDEPDALLRYADQAMYQAKETGKAQIRYFDAGRHQSSVQRKALLPDVERALENDEFELYFQPRVSLIDGSLAGAEALLRWFRASGTVPPDVVVEVVTGSSVEWTLDRWVIRKMLKFMEHLRPLALQGPFSFNINPRTVENPALPEFLSSLLAERNPLGQDLEMEILEVSSISNFTQTRDNLLRCKSMGFSLSLDDFGTGYSSLTHFHALPVDKIKIDKGFITNILSDAGNRTLVRSILALAKANETPTVAEGIESYAIARELAALGCEYGQGFAIAMPMPIEDYLALASNWDQKEFMRLLAESA